MTTRRHPLAEFNPYHDPATGRFTSGPGGPRSTGKQDRDSRPVITAARLNRELMQRLEEEGGFTYDNVAGDYPAEGFAFATDKPTKVIDASEIRPSDIMDYMDEHADALADEEVMLGGWLDTETGKVHLDLSLVADDRDRAVELAKKHNQIAAWDLAAGEEIDLREYLSEAGQQDHPVHLDRGGAAEFRPHATRLQSHPAHGWSPPAYPGRGRRRTPQVGAEAVELGGDLGPRVTPPLYEFNPYHDPATGRFTHAPGGSSVSDGERMATAVSRLDGHGVSTTVSPGWDERKTADMAEELADLMDEYPGVGDSLSVVQFQPMGSDFVTYAEYSALGSSITFNKTALNPDDVENGLSMASARRYHVADSLRGVAAHEFGHAIDESIRSHDMMSYVRSRAQPEVLNQTPRAMISRSITSGGMITEYAKHGRDTSQFSKDREAFAEGFAASKGHGNPSQNYGTHGTTFDVSTVLAQYPHLKNQPPLGEFNPYHDPATGRFTTGPASGGGDGEEGSSTLPTVIPVWDMENGDMPESAMADLQQRMNELTDRYPEADVSEVFIGVTVEDIESQYGFFGGEGWEDTFGQYEMETGAILLNAGLIGPNLQMLTRAKESGWMVSENPGDILTHEYGHGLENTFNRASWRVETGTTPHLAWQDRWLSGSRQPLGAHQVSTYARTSAGEMFAETFTASWKGIDAPIVKDFDRMVTDMRKWMAEHDSD